MFNIYSLMVTVLLSPLGYAVYFGSYRIVVKFSLHRPVQIFFLLDERGMAAIINSESIEKVDPSRLKPHPVNREVYREDKAPGWLVESVKEVGILEPVEAKEDGTIISGHSRWRVAKKLDVKLPVLRVSYESRLEEERTVIESNQQRDKTFSQRMREADKLKEIEEEKAKERQKKLGKTHGVTPSDKNLSKGRTDEKVAGLVGFGSRETYRKAKKVWEKAEKGDETPEAQVERLDKEKTTIHNAYKYVKRQERREEIEEKIEELPEGKFNVILADPPWKYEWSISKTREIENQYPTMSLDEIKDVDVPAADDAVLFLWATAPRLPWAFEVMEAWGFEYVTGAVWDKETMGMGYWFRGQHEHLLVGKKGDFSPPERDKRKKSVIREKKTKHSAKPEMVYEILESYFPDAKRLELFARGKREGWTLWGPEVGLKPKGSSEKSEGVNA